MTSYAAIEKTLRQSVWAVRYTGADVRSDREGVTGPELYADLAARGLVNDWRELTEVEIGGRLVIGLTSFARTL